MLIGLTFRRVISREKGRREYLAPYLSLQRSCHVEAEILNL